ncbi:T3SS effector HopA1 family protein, partial [Corallococcus exiguus]
SAPAPGGAPGPHLLVEALWPRVYAQFYARPGSLSGQAAPLATDLLTGPADPAFVARLSAANRSQTRWDSLWTVYQPGPQGALHVQKGDVHRLAGPEEYVFPVAPGRPPRVGDTVSLRVPRESIHAQPGFYYAFGETVPSGFDDVQLARLYFHAPPDSVPWLLEQVTGDLNRYQVPFRMKCLDSPANYDRADAVVLYVTRRYLPITLRLLSAHTEELTRRLKPGVPLFTREWGPGVGLADEPGTGESFGQSRARLVCQGIVEAWQRGLTSNEERLRAVMEQFDRLGLSLEKPYLSEGLVEVHPWPGSRSDDRDTREAA